MGTTDNTIVLSEKEMELVTKLRAYEEKKAQFNANYSQPNTNTDQPQEKPKTVAKFNQQNQQNTEEVDKLKKQIADLEAKFKQPQPEPEPQNQQNTEEVDKLKKQFADLEANFKSAQLLNTMNVNSNQNTSDTNNGPYTVKDPFDITDVRLCEMLNKVFAKMKGAQQNG